MMKIRRSTFLTFLVGLMSATASAQFTEAPLRFEQDPDKVFFRNGHLDLGLNVGTAGIGLELSTPVTDWMRVRAGFNWMPPFNFPMNFDVTTFGGTEDITSENMDRLQEIMDFYHMHVDEKVKMNATPTMFDGKLLIDFSPIPDYREWHVTAGFHIGGKRIGKATNDAFDAASMVVINVYNRMYDYFTEHEFFDTPLPGTESTDFTISIPVGLELAEKFERYGRMGIHIGDFKDGTPYYMEPDEYAQVSANCYTNVFKPYLGIGYNGCPTSDKRLRIGFDAGVLFWGGTPDVIAHDGVNMTKDLVNVKGKVGDYLRFVKGLKVLPTVSFKISYTLF